MLVPVNIFKGKVLFIDYNLSNYFMRSLLFESPPRNLRIALFLQAGRQPPLLHKVKIHLQHYLKLGKHLIFYIADDLAAKTCNINLYQGSIINYIINSVEGI